MIARRTASVFATVVLFDGFPAMANLLFFLGGFDNDNGLFDLQSSTNAAFNRRNVNKLPSGIVYNAIAADADQNANGAIDNTPDEYLELREESSGLAFIHGLNASLARSIVDVMYQLLRNVAGVTVVYTVVPNIGTVATLVANPTPGPLGNDTLVTIPSGLGAGSYLRRITPPLGNTFIWSGPAGRNHSSVADSGNTVGTWIINIEKANGDLK